MQDTVRRDAAGVALATLAYFALACHFELSERLNRWASGHETWQVDELPLTLLVLAAALGWFAWRRLREARHEARERCRAEEANRMLMRRLLTLQEDERRRLARELHDELGQCCVAIRAEASFLGRHVKADSKAAASARALGDTAEHVQHIVRSMLRRLRPSALDDLGLGACVQDLAETWGQRHAIACTFAAEGAIEGLDETASITAYRIVQECLTNIAKHSGASRAAIRIRRESEALLGVAVEDDGQGLPAAGAHGGLGLLGMSERAAALGGNLRVGHGALGGLCVEASLPLRQ
jgi:two-component system sensor histidine kinase UhpB